MSLQTKAFGALAALLAMPAVVLVASLTISDRLDETAYYMGYLFTWTAVGSIFFTVTTGMSAVCDLFRGD